MEKIKAEKEHFELFNGARVGFSLGFWLTENRTDTMTREMKLLKSKLIQEIAFKSLHIDQMK